MQVFVNVPRWSGDVSRMMQEQFWEHIYKENVTDARLGNKKDIYEITDKAVFSRVCTAINSIIRPTLVDVTKLFPAGDYSGPFFCSQRLADTLRRMQRDGVMMYPNFMYRPAGETCGWDVNGQNDLRDQRGHWIGEAIDNKNTKSARAMGLSLAHYHALLQREYNLVLIMPVKEAHHLQHQAVME